MEAYCDHPLYRNGNKWVDGNGNKRVDKNGNKWDRQLCVLRAGEFVEFGQMAHAGKLNVGKFAT